MGILKTLSIHNFFKESSPILKPNKNGCLSQNRVLTREKHNPDVFGDKRCEQERPFSF